jgi:hypothetical protein
MRLRFCLLLICALTACGDSTGPEARRNLNVLLIGNSYTYFNRLDTLLTQVAAAAGKGRTLHAEMVAVSGYALQNHWHDGAALAAIRRRGWDYVVLQEQSFRPIYEPELFLEFATKFDAEIRAAGAHTVLLITWVAPSDSAPQQQQITATITGVANQLKALSVAAGPAFIATRQQHPAIELYSDIYGHPSWFGSYLVAAMFYATLFRESPESAIGSPDEHALRAVAWSTYLQFAH